jgi:predicted XRE-type DNA-binding protein
MGRLTTEQIADMKEYFSRSKEVKTSSLAMKLSHDGLKLIDTIEAQQQEIEQLGKLHQSRIDSLVADKDAQVEKLKLMETVLKNARTALELLRHMNPEEFCFVFEVRCAIDALIGGKENDK